MGSDRRLLQLPSLASLRPSPLLLVLLAALLALALALHRSPATLRAVSLFQPQPRPSRFGVLPPPPPFASAEPLFVCLTLCLNGDGAGSTAPAALKSIIVADLQHGQWEEGVAPLCVGCSSARRLGARALFF